MGYLGVGAVTSPLQGLRALRETLDELDPAWEGLFPVPAFKRDDAGQYIYPAFILTTKPVLVPGTNVIVWPSGWWLRDEQAWNELVFSLGKKTSQLGYGFPLQKNIKTAKERL